MLGNAEAILRRSARISDANRREIEEARSLNFDMAEAVAGARAAFDVITVIRFLDTSLARPEVTEVK